MNVNPPAYPVQQMPQQLPYGYPTPTSRQSLQFLPQQSPVHHQFFPGSVHPNDNQQHQIHYQQQPPPPLQQQQHFPPQQRYQVSNRRVSHQIAHSFYGNSGNHQLPGNGLMPTPASNVSPQVYAHVSNNQGLSATFPPASPFKPTVASPSVPSTQPSHSMVAPAALLVSNTPLPQRPTTQEGGIVQHPQLQTLPQVQVVNQAQSSAQQPQSPQSVVREKSRVSVLLEINSYLLQEVVSLQAQGKAGGPPPSLPQQSPIQETGAGSPASATDPSNPLNQSPIDPTKPTGAKPSQEYIECMRRLQANLAYLAAIADAKKKAAGSVPVAPAIMAPPPHLVAVRELYKQLNALFLGAGQTSPNKATGGSGPHSQSIS